MSVFKRIEPTDVTVTPFIVHKTIDEVSGSDVVLEYLANFQDSTYNLSDPSDYEAVALPKTTGDRYQFIIHDSINHSFYENFVIPREGTLAEENAGQRRRLYNSALVLAVDQNYYGEGLKPGTILITTDVNGTVHTIVDDGIGNLIDQTLSSSYSDSFSEFNSNVVGHWNFSDSYNDTKKVRDISKYRKDALLTDITFDNVFSLYDGIYDGVGSFARVTHNDVWNFKKSDDFCILAVFKTSVARSASPGDMFLVTKNGRTSTEFHGSEIFQLDTEKESQYPFELRFQPGSTGRVIGQRSDGKNVTTVTSTSLLDDNAKHIVHLVKTGSNLELWVDGTREDVQTDITKFSTHNNSDLFIGSKGETQGFYSGSIYDVRIYNKGIPGTAITAGSTAQLNQYDDYYVGNVFYEHGFAVLTNPSTYYSRLSNYDALVQDTPTRDWSFYARGTKTAYEYEIICKIDASDLNSTVNPSALDFNDPTAFASFTSHSLFNPYVTQVGLFNEDAQLLAVANVSQPIPKLKDKDMAFVVRFDV